MAKQSIPGLSTGGGSVKAKLIGTIVLIALIAFIVKQPTEAAEAARNIIGLFGGALDGATTFVDQVAS